MIFGINDEPIFDINTLLSSNKNIAYSDKSIALNLLACIVANK